jgi:hypothetical protein
VGDDGRSVCLCWQTADSPPSVLMHQWVSECVSVCVCVRERDPNKALFVCVFACVDRLSCVSAQCSVFRWGRAHASVMRLRACLLPP